MFENGEENNYKELIRNTELAEAYEDGYKEGKKEVATSVAKNLKKAGLEISLIAEVTGLSVKEIDFLKEEA